MSEQFSEDETTLPRRKRRKVTRWLLAGITLVSIGLGYNSAIRKEQAFRTLVTKSGCGDVMDFSPDAKLLATANRCNPAVFKVWDLERDSLLLTGETTNNGGIGLIAMSPDKTMLVTSGRHDDERLFLWDLRTGKQIAQMKSAFFDSTSLMFSPDSKWIINSGFTFAEVWDVSTKQLLKVWPEDKGNFFFALMPDGETLLMVRKSGIKFRNLQTGRLLREVTFARANTKQYLEAALSPDGKTLALGVRLGQDQPETIELWDVGSGRLRLILAKNSGNKKWGKPAMRSLSFSRDNKLLASSGSNQPVNLWDMQTGSVRANFEEKVPSPKWISDEKTVAFSPDGTTLAVGIQNEVHLWKVDTLLKP